MSRLLCLALIGAFMTTAAWAQTNNTELPAPIAALEDRGASIGEAFDAPDGLTGYTVSFQGQTLAAYVTASGEHVVVGTLLDGDGTNLSQPVLQAAANAARPETEWQALAEAAWIADGGDNAEHVVYAFTDPNCPFCHRFYEQTRDWIDAGDVQIRHVMVGVLRRTAPSATASTSRHAIGLMPVTCRFVMSWSGSCARTVWQKAPPCSRPMTPQPRWLRMRPISITAV